MQGYQSFSHNSFTCSMPNYCYNSFQNAFGGNERYINSELIGISSYVGGIRMATNIFENNGGIDFGPK